MLVKDKEEPKELFQNSSKDFLREKQAKKF
jgi:hypothetical protein